MSSIYRLNQFVLAVFFSVFFTKNTEAQYSASMTATPTNISCYSGSLNVNYSCVVTPPGGQIYGTDYTITASSFKLRTTASGVGGTVLLTNSGGTAPSNTITGSFNMSVLPTGVYTVYADLTVTAGKSVLVVQTNSTFTIGYQVNWATLIDMTASPNSYSCYRNTSSMGVTYAKAQSSNYLTPNSDGWMEFTGQFSSSSSTRSVYIPLTDFTGTFNPSSSTAVYIEYRKGGTITNISGEGVYFKNGTTTFKFQGMVLSDRIRVQRVSGTYLFYKTNSINALSAYNVSTSVLSTPAYSNSGDLYVLGYSTTTGADGLMSVITSFSCTFDNQFFQLKDEVEQSVAYVMGNRLNFKYNEDYFDNAGNLNYSIKCLNDDGLPTTVTVSKPTHTNWIKIPLGAGGVTLVNGNTYLLTVTDIKGRKQYLKFKKA